MSSTVSSAIALQSMQGLGDCIYFRPFVRALTERATVFLSTPWPEIFQDLPVIFRKCLSRLRTQTKHIKRNSLDGLPDLPSTATILCPRYTSDELKRGSILAALELQMPLGATPFLFDLPRYASPITRTPYAVIRPVTARKEWMAMSRAPNPVYLQQALVALQQAGCHIVTIADVEEGVEWLVQPTLVGMDEAYYAGEIYGENLIGLIQGAAACVGGVGWIVPMAMAAQVPLLVIAGGRGAHNAPEVITDPRMDLTKATFALPEHFCRCDMADHACDKTIINFPAILEVWIAQHLG